MKIVTVASDNPELIVCQQHYFIEISERFGVSFDPYAGEDDAMSNVWQRHVLSVRKDKAVGCGSLRDLGDGVAEVKRVWVTGPERGKGTAQAIMDALEAMASEEGFAAIRLDTNHTLGEAQALYRKRGYGEIERYNDNPYADHFFEKRL